MSFDHVRLARIDQHFARYVDDGRLKGWQLQVGQHGTVEHSAYYGMADVEAERPVAEDTLWRIYSMTKPVVSVAFMTLWEQGLVDLNDELRTYLPEFAEVQVFQKGSATTPFLEPALEPIRLWHLLSHTSGLTYGFLQSHPVDAIYRAAGSDLYQPEGNDLAANCRLWASLPLRFQPGTAFGYGVSTDVLGRVCEVVSGQPLDVFLRGSVLGPLGMDDTRWWADGGENRMAGLYAAFDGQAYRYDQLGASAFTQPRHLSGGGGLISTADDYWRFCQMLIGKGSREGVRVLAPRTLELMTLNHLPGGQDLGALNTGGFAETVFDGIGFGLGFAMVLDPRPSHSPSSVGEYYWGGLASTAFFIDPSTGVSATFFSQLVPSSTYPIRAELRQLVYSALLD